MSLKAEQGRAIEDAIRSNKEIGVTMKDGIRKALHSVGTTMVKDTRQRMTNKDKSGRIYTVYRGIGGASLKRGRRHVASGPREYPSVISGKLRKSVDFKVRGGFELEFGAGGGRSNVDYAKALEEGTNKVAARKYLEQTVRRYEDTVTTEISKRINIDLKKSDIIVKKTS